MGARPTCCEDPGFCMRLLIYKLADATHHSVLLSLIDDGDAAELVELIDDAVGLLRLRRFDVILLLAGGNIRAANLALQRLRDLAPNVAVVLLNQPGAERSGIVPRMSASRRNAISIDQQAGTLSVDGNTLPLSQAEFRIFAQLWERRGQTVTADELLDAIYPDGNWPESRVLPVFLFKLRRKLGTIGLADLVQTAVGRGFMILEPDEVAQPADADN